MAIFTNKNDIDLPLLTSFYQLEFPMSEDIDELINSELGEWLQNAGVHLRHEADPERPGKYRIARFPERPNPEIARETAHKTMIPLVGIYPAVKRLMDAIADGDIPTGSDLTKLEDATAQITHSHFAYQWSGLTQEQAAVLKGKWRQYATNPDRRKWLVMRESVAPEIMMATMVAIRNGTPGPLPEDFRQDFTASAVVFPDGPPSDLPKPTVFLQEQSDEYDKPRQEMIERLRRAVLGEILLSRCPVCHNPFVKPRRDAMYCSWRCSQRAKMRRYNSRKESDLAPIALQNRQNRVYCT